MPDADNLKPGDKVRVRLIVSDERVLSIQVDGTVVYRVAELRSLELICRGYKQNITLPEIVHVEPRPLKVGDRVMTNDHIAGVVRAIEDNCAWVRFTKEVYSTEYVNALKRIPEAVGDGGDV